MSTTRSAPRRSSLFARRGLDGSVHASWAASVQQTGRRRERVLAWAPMATPAAGDQLPPGGPGVVIGSVGVLSVLFGGLVGEQSWRHIGWHEIETGEWNGELAELRWTGHDGVRGSVQLAQPGGMPELFRERIAASIAVEETLEVGRGRRLTVSGRRDLGRPDESLIWRRTLSRGLAPSTPGLDELTEATLDRLRAEYDSR